MERNIFLICIICLVAGALALGVKDTKENTVEETPGVSEVKLFYIALNDNGKMGKQIGCEDSVVPVAHQISPTQAPLTATLHALLSEKRSNIEPGLYNSLSQSTLFVDSVSIANGIATVHLSGSISLGGVCDVPRLEAQLKETALQFATVSEAEFFLNGEPLSRVLSQQ